MKTKLYYIIMLFCLIVSAGCSDDYDDSKLWDSVNGLENRVAKLEELCKQMNTNISSLQEIVTALQKNESIKSVSTLPDGSGYLITFSSGKTITIYHGKNGVDGEDGKDGENGKDAITPVISVKKDADGIYYWTVNNDWLLIDGKKVKAEGTDGADGVDGKPGIDGEDGTNGKDGITPQFKIEDGYWYISYDNEQSWTKLGKATGDSGLNGDSIFANVEDKDVYVEFTLNDNTSFKIPKFDKPAFIISENIDVDFFDYGETKVYNANTYNVVSISISDPDGWTVVFENGVLSITAPVADNKYAKNKGIVSIVAISNTGCASITNISVYCQSLLSSNDRYANCYIIPSAGTYSFETKSRDGLVVYSGKYADYLWKTDDNLVTDISYNDNIISFKASGNKGNAVIALLNENNEIIWSWHIWCTNISITEMAQSIDMTIWLDRNLGATYSPENMVDCNNITSNVSKKDLIDTYGLYYQWGRKDPFISGNIAKTPSIADAWEKDKFNTWTIPTFCNSKIVNSNWSFNDRGFTMHEMTNYPMCINAISSYQYLWASDVNVNLNWNDSQKSNYDPCPYGYRVPTAEEVQDTFCNQMFQAQEYGVAFEENGSFIWLPLAGVRERSGVIYNIGRTGHIWTCDYSHDGFHKSLRVYNDCINDYSLNGTALSVRCIKDENA